LSAVTALDYGISFCMKDKFFEVVLETSLSSKDQSTLCIP